MRVITPHAGPGAPAALKKRFMKPRHQPGPAGMLVYREEYYTLFQLKVPLLLC